MIKTVVFDIGNVLLQFAPQEYVDRLFPDSSLVREYYSAVFLSAEWTELDRGTLSQADAVQVICDRNPAYREAIDRIFAGWLDMLLPIEPTVALLRELKEAGYKTYALSNFHSKARDYVVQKYSWFELFDGMTVSCDVQANKPEEQIYHALLNDHSLNPEECVFIDDVLANIKAAEDLGITGIHFQDPEQCRLEIYRLLGL